MAEESQDIITSQGVFDEWKKNEIHSLYGLYERYLKPHLNDTFPEGPLFITYVGDGGNGWKEAYVLFQLFPDREIYFDSIDINVAALQESLANWKNLNAPKSVTHPHQKARFYVADATIPGALHSNHVVIVRNIYPGGEKILESAMEAAKPQGLVLVTTKYRGEMRQYRYDQLAQAHPRFSKMLEQTELSSQGRGSIRDEQLFVAQVT